VYDLTTFPMSQMIECGAALRRLGQRAGSMEETEAASLGKLVVFSGLSEFPIRVKCASLPWHALKAALNEPDTVVSTE